ncbi:ankyrin repeat domain-containing protein [Acinetobacter sp. IK40]|jgi:ankyrin repeat protein|uniref:ankyrin repeat domain-containing protein n=1 Tax=Acinetobacter sp. IK40 TaxID=2928897 RepID=UPI002D1F0AE1|nr:ankyrin repeat domain-containing protein [Acinetobacter sp. IK40]MEB3791356.1 ankyrin repeat domain-containing protein [Acinetobacter sp. IK40]
MLNKQQQALVQAIQQLDLDQVQSLLAEGLDPNFIDPEQGPPVSVICDGLFTWWEAICEAYEAGQPLSEEEKQQSLQVYLDILDALIQAKANLHLWDAEEFYGPLWDAASSACVPVVQRLLEEKVDPNTRDEEGLTVLSSISQLFFDCEFDEIDWSESLPEERATLELLRQHGAKMSKELGT